MKRVLGSTADAAAFLLATDPSLAQTLETDRTVSGLEVVATFNGPMPTGVTVSRHNRVFVNFPRWGDDVPFTVGEMVNGQAVAYPDAKVNDWPGRTKANPNAFMDEEANQTHFVNVQSVVVDAEDRLWALDTGAPKLKNIVPGGPKLVAIDLKTNKIVKTILLPPESAGTNSYMNDVRFDLSVGQHGTQDPQTMIGSRSAPDPDKPAPDPKHPAAERSAGKAAGGGEIFGTAYITDSSSQGPNAIVVVDLATGKSWRRLNQHVSVLGEPGFVMFAEGQPMYETLPGHPDEPNLFAADGIAISADGKELYYCPISGTKLYGVSTEALRDRTKSDAWVASTVRIVTGKMPSDGMESDVTGNVYLTDPVTNSIHTYNVKSGEMKTLVHDPRLVWPDTMSVTDDGWLYVTANQLNRQASMHHGKDERVKPYVLFRVKIDSKAVRLK